jgi:hypothetical protein
MERLAYHHLLELLHAIHTPRIPFDFILGGMTREAFYEQLTLPCDEATCDKMFESFSMSRSWYKHVPLPKDMYILPLVVNGIVEWDIADKRHLRNTEPLITPSMAAAIRAHPIAINALVFAGGPTCKEFRRYGISITQDRGGDAWLAWLRTSGYTTEADHIAQTSYLKDDDPIVIRLRQVEYARMLAEFKTKLTAILAQAATASL